MISDREYPVQKHWVMKFSVVAFIFMLAGVGMSLLNETAFDSILVVAIGALALLCRQLLRKFFHYQFDADFLTVHQGVIEKTERHIPYAVMQNIHITRDPLDRWLGLATLRVENAARSAPTTAKRGIERAFQLTGTIGSTPNGIVIPGLKKEHADIVRSALLQKVKDYSPVETGSGL